MRKKKKGGLRSKKDQAQSRSEKGNKQSKQERRSRYEADGDKDVELQQREVSGERLKLSECRLGIRTGHTRL